MLPIRGMVPVLPTPFDGAEEIDAPSLGRVIDYCIDHGAAAVCLPAYGGEFYKLSDAERIDVVRLAVNHSNGRIPVIGQANHPSSRIAIDLALQMQDIGVDLISVAVPRVFGLGEDDLLRYFIPLSNALSVPLLIQDFNPGGPTVGPQFAKRLHEECPNFRYLKLEEPMMGSKAAGIIEATAGGVSVLEGWGGMYMLELIPSGICGVMPGVAAFPVLDRAYRLHIDGNIQAAYEVFSRILPFIVYQLQHMELYLNSEKRILHRLGLLDKPQIREAALSLDPAVIEYGDFLIDRVIEVLDGSNDF
ncbi:MAG: dihydrodipicolinate synthase family protein [Candidatus Latescibacteria bacterium]|jgi:2-keto-3-deoxy-L-arabinonate dehydratase|nr:dihydrodipicolinate synthase family protein [Candidatus Latescibacterota bacterium]